jgi:predicted alpha/beta-hydrolase family hydrolase
MAVEPIELASSTDGPNVRGFLHSPGSPARAGLILTHSAGSDCASPLLMALAEAFTQAGVLVLRCDLPFRQQRPHGPPRPGDAPRDREGLRRAVEAVRQLTPQPLWLGGHSYGGRQASMLAAEDPALISALLLLSYPLHPPRKPSQLRTAHFPSLRTPVLFVHGMRDGFASPAEMEQALKLIPAPVRLLPVAGAGHDLGFAARKQVPELAGKIAAEFLSYTSLCAAPSAGTTML